MTNRFSDETARLVSQVIRARRTSKILALDDQVVLHPHDDLTEWNRVVVSAIADAGFAPFHYDRKLDGVVEPWRFHLIWQNECRSIGKQISNWFPEMSSNNKLPSMLAACGCLVLINWIPQFDGIIKDEKQTQIDEEHLGRDRSGNSVIPTLANRSQFEIVLVQWRLFPSTRNGGTPGDSPKRKTVVGGFR